MSVSVQEQARNRRSLLIVMLLLILVLILPLSVLVGGCTYCLAKIWPMSLAEKIAVAEAIYGEEVKGARAEIDALVAEFNEERRQAIAAIPPGSAIGPDWDFCAALNSAWDSGESQILESFRILLLERHENDEREWSFMEEYVARQVEAGSATPLDMHLNPREHGREEAMRRFQDYVLTAPFLDQMEEAIDLGLFPVRLGTAAFLCEERTNSARLATRLLACRAVAHANRGDFESACATACRLYEAFAASRNCWGRDYIPFYCGSLAQDLVRKLMEERPLPTRDRKRILACYAHASGPDRTRLRLLSMALMPRNQWFLEPLSEAQKELWMYRWYGQAKDFIALMDKPCWETGVQRSEITHRFPWPFWQGMDKPEMDASTLWEMVRSYINTRSECDPISYDYCFFYGEDMELLVLARADAILSKTLVESAFALSDYKAVHSAYPDTLDELGPEWPSRVPVYWRTGKPVIYARNGDGYTFTTAVPGKQSGTDSLGETEVLWSMRR